MGRHRKVQIDRWGNPRDLPHLTVDPSGVTMKCRTCEKFRSREDLYETVCDTECLLCRRRRDRLQGIDMEPHSGELSVSEQRRHVAISVGAARNKKELAEREGAFDQWKRDRRKELQLEGLKFGADHRQLKLEVPEKRLQMGLPAQ